MSLLFQKQAERSYDLAGRLYLATGGYLMLSVPNSIVRGAFDALDEPGAELPPSGDDGKLNAHISVMRPEEIKEHIGSPDKITERGHSFHYSVGQLNSFNPKGWVGMSKVWVIEVKSPELEKLRKSYGMTNLPKNNEFAFHISIAARRKSVLRPNDVKKAASLLNLALPTCAKYG